MSVQLAQKRIERMHDDDDFVFGECVTRGLQWCDLVPIGYVDYITLWPGPIRPWDLMYKT